MKEDKLRENVLTYISFTGIDSDKRQYHYLKMFKKDWGFKAAKELIKRIKDYDRGKYSTVYGYDLPKKLEVGDKVKIIGNNWTAGEKGEVVEIGFERLTQVAQVKLNINNKLYFNIYLESELEKI